MTDESVFRILGPIMTGPSSSHTAGAVRIGRTARLLYGRTPKKVIVYFHGSFAETWKGHGSDKAVIGGLLGYKTYDERIKNAEKYAEEVGMFVSFQRIDLGQNYHPNTIKIIIKNDKLNNEIDLIAESVGGGDIIIREIMGFKTEITGELNTIILRHEDLLGTLSSITGIISDSNLNIVSLRSKDIPKKNIALTAVEISQSVPDSLKEKLLKITGMKFVRILPKISAGEEML
ncbi:MAG: L-serine ammonia-lyase, iron-sulfur-dependent subunit beta [Asgard group archaeon]|nr:L-serine ammonia-lyase, iron-sulfur-dependent subunit beta [Asgard group archaeon]